MPSKYRLSFFAASTGNTIVPVNIKDDDWGTAIEHILRLVTQLECIQQDDLTLDSLQVLFVLKDNLCASQFFQNLSGHKDYLLQCAESDAEQVALRNTFYFGERPNKDYRPAPIITIGPLEVMDIYEEAPPLEFETTPTKWKKSRENTKWLYSLNLDHRIKFLDSGIWHRYVAYDDSFEDNFLKLVKNMVGYADKRLYHSLASLASLEFQCRILQHSFIHKFGERGHHDAVTPFKFHSETIAAQKIEKFITFFKGEDKDKARLSDIKWNIMLIDDYSEAEMSTIDESKAPTKFLLVEDILKQCEIKFNLTSNGSGSKVIEQSINHLKKDDSTIDLLLLDYLLGESDSDKNHKAYGHEFLLELAESNCNRGPLGRYWIVLSSSFPFAFNDKLRQLSIDGSTERWHISNGGDPITTPEMYKLRILRLLLRQISECYLFDAALQRQVDRFDGIKELGQWCNALINRIEADRQIRKSLEAERDRNSLFAETMEIFLSKQTDYDAFLIRLEKWLRFFSYYRTGLPGSEYLEDLDKISTEFSDFSSVCEYIGSKAEGFIQDSVAEINEQVKRGETTIKLSGNGILYDFPENIVHSCLSVINLDLSSSRLITLPDSITEFKQLEHLDLSNNFELEYLPAKKMLEQNKNLKIINLKNTKIGDSILGKCPIYANKAIATQKILTYIDKHISISRKVRKSITGNTQQFNIFISYAHQDHKWLLELEKHLSALTRRGINIWYDTKMIVGADWDSTIKQQIKQADLKLLLLSSDFMASEYITNVEIPLITDGHRENKNVIPIYLRYCDLTVNEDIYNLQGLPVGGYEKPILSSHYLNTDEAFFIVATGIRKYLEEKAATFLQNNGVRGQKQVQ